MIRRTRLLAVLTGIQDQRLSVNFLRVFLSATRLRSKMSVVKESFTRTDTNSHDQAPLNL